MTATGPRSVLLAGGGTAGHVSPLLALADCLRRRDPEVRVTALGTAAGLEARLVPERGYPLLEVPKVPFPRRPSGDLLRLPGNLRRAVRAAEDAIESTGAEVVVGFGGYVSTPAYLAARRRGTPVVVHEQNARPGLANRLGARIAAGVGVTFPGTPLPHATVTGMPLRREIATLDRAARRAEARERFGLDRRPHRPRHRRLARGAAPQRRVRGGGGRACRPPASRCCTSPGRARSSPRPAPPVPATSSCPTATGWTSPTRPRTSSSPASGANTVCELTAVGLPAVYVPLPIGNGEQRLNAAAVVAAGGGILVDDAAVDAALGPRRGAALVTDASRLEAMAAASASVGERDGDELLADLVVAAAAGGR